MINRRSIPPAVPLDPIRADVIERRGINPFAPTVVQVLPFPSNGPTLVLNANSKRIGAWIYAPVQNNDTVIIGGRNLQDLAFNSNGFDTEPGTGWWINDTTDALYATTMANGVVCLLKVWESVTG